MQERQESSVPSVFDSALFHVKAVLLQTRRAALDVSQGVERFPLGDERRFPHIIVESRTPLWSDESIAELPLQQGKVHNLRRAVKRLNGIVIPASATFSFWKQVGRATEGRGYVAGRLLREGCIIPAIGGGLCQLSNALYAIALDSGFEIVERHAHSRIVPGSIAEQGRDATIAWNYIDLRFRPAARVLLKAELTADTLIVGVYAENPLVIAQQKHRIDLAMLSDTGLSISTREHSCATCGEESCFRHTAVARLTTGIERTAYLIDEQWPEFLAYVNVSRQSQDQLGVPRLGSSGHSKRSEWDMSGYSKVFTAPREALARSLAARRFGRYGARRLQAQFEATRSIALRLAHHLGAEITSLCVAQSFLPFLWEQGELGGRQFEVLMTRLPLAALHQRLDSALAEHPERKTLGEYRAPESIVRSETAALAAAERIVTPHPEIAALYADRAVLLDWQMPKPATFTPGRRIAFPGPTAARKGAYELRSVARALVLEVALRGRELEGEEFWSGVRTVRPANNADWLDGVCMAVQPALAEDRPHHLLAALAAGLQVVASPACGLGERAGVVTVQYGDEQALRIAIERVLAQQNRSETAAKP